MPQTISREGLEKHVGKHNVIVKANGISICGTLIDPYMGQLVVDGTQSTTIVDGDELASSARLASHQLVGGEVISLPAVRIRSPSGRTKFLAYRTYIYTN